ASPGPPGGATKGPRAPRTRPAGEPLRNLRRAGRATPRKGSAPAGDGLPRSWSPPPAERRRTQPVEEEPNAQSARHPRRPGDPLEGRGRLGRIGRRRRARPRPTQARLVLLQPARRARELPGEPFLQAEQSEVRQGVEGRHVTRPRAPPQRG